MMSIFQPLCSQQGISYTIVVQYIDDSYLSLVADDFGPLYECHQASHRLQKTNHRAWPTTDFLFDHIIWKDTAIEIVSIVIIATT